MAGRVSAKARQKRKKFLVRVFTIVVAVIMVGGILLASVLTNLY